MCPGTNSRCDIFHFLINFSTSNIYGLANAGEAAKAAMLIRPTFTGPSQSIQVYGLVNSGAVLCVAALTVGSVALRNRDLRTRLSSSYLQRG